MLSRAIAPLLLCLSWLSGQDSVPPEFMYHRVWAVVPIIGAGTKEDPKRPMFAPSPAEARQQGLAGAENAKAGKVVEPPPILSYSMQISDDGKSALVEFVGISPQALKFITESRAEGVRVFERGKAKKEDIEAEFKKHKAGFKIESLSGTRAR